MLGFIGYGDAARAIAKGLHETVGVFRRKRRCLMKMAANFHMLSAS